MNSFIERLLTDINDINKKYECLGELVENKVYQRYKDMISILEENHDELEKLGIKSFDKFRNCTELTQINSAAANPTPSEILSLGAAFGRLNRLIDEIEMDINPEVIVKIKEIKEIREKIKNKPIC